MAVFAPVVSKPLLRKQPEGTGARRGSSGMGPHYRPKRYREVETALGYFSRQLSSKQTV